MAASDVQDGKDELAGGRKEPFAIEIVDWHAQGLRLICERFVYELCACEPTGAIRWKCLRAAQNNCRGGVTTFQNSITSRLAHNHPAIQEDVDETRANPASEYPMLDDGKDVDKEDVPLAQLYKRPSGQNAGAATLKSSQALLKSVEDRLEAAKRSIAYEKECMKKTPKRSKARSFVKIKKTFRGDQRYSERLLRQRSRATAQSQMATQRMTVDLTKDAEESSDMHADEASLSSPVPHPQELSRAVDTAMSIASKPMLTKSSMSLSPVVLPPTQNAKKTTQTMKMRVVSGAQPISMRSTAGTGPSTIAKPVVAVSTTAGPRLVPMATDGRPAPVPAVAEQGAAVGGAQQPPRTGMRAGEDVCLRWNNHHHNVQTTFGALLRSEKYVDVTLCADGQMIPCHKIVLASCSPYFDEIIGSMAPWQHPVIFLKGVQLWVLRALIEFMYIGEVSIEQSKLAAILEMAHELKIKGLTSRAPPPGTILHAAALSMPTHAQAAPPPATAPPTPATSSGIKTAAPLNMKAKQAPSAPSQVSSAPLPPPSAPPIGNMRAPPTAPPRTANTAPSVRPPGGATAVRLLRVMKPSEMGAPPTPNDVTEITPALPPPPSSSGKRYFIASIAPPAGKKRKTANMTPKARNEAAGMEITSIPEEKTRKKAPAEGEKSAQPPNAADDLNRSIKMEPLDISDTDVFFQDRILDFAALPALEDPFLQLKADEAQPPSDAHDSDAET